MALTLTVQSYRHYYFHLVRLMHFSCDESSKVVFLFYAKILVHSKHAMTAINALNDVTIVSEYSQIHYVGREVQYWGTKTQSCYSSYFKFVNER